MLQGIYITCLSLFFLACVNFSTLTTANKKSYSIVAILFATCLLHKCTPKLEYKKYKKYEYSKLTKELLCISRQNSIINLQKITVYNEHGNSEFTTITK